MNKRKTYRERKAKDNGISLSRFIIEKCREKQ